MKTRLLHLVSAFALISSASAQTQPGIALPDRRPGEFKGKIGETYKDSKPDFPLSRKAPKDAPNVVLILLDESLDVGEDTGTPVSEDYKVPFKFTGKVVADLK